MDLGKNYAGILAKIIFEAKNSKKMKFEDVLDIAEKRAQLFVQEGFSIEKLPETVSKPLSAKYILKKGNKTYQVTVPDKESMDKVYDFSSEKDVTEYTDSMDMETILNNLEKAGMPEGWLESLIGQNNASENTEEAENWELKPAA